MTISKPVEDAINAQINRELYSHYLYLAMAVAFEVQNYAGFGKWLKAQAAEEQRHAYKFMNHIIERGGTVKLEAIEQPPVEWPNLLDAFEAAHKHEGSISAHIIDILAVARKENDIASEPLLMWFIDEQVEEEQQADEVVQKLKMAGDNKGALYILDREMGQRSE